MPGWCHVVRVGPTSRALTLGSRSTSWGRGIQSPNRPRSAVHRPARMARSGRADQAGGRHWVYPAIVGSHRAQCRRGGQEDGDYFGGPVVEAARIRAAATGGQILATDVVRSLVGGRATQTFSEVGPLELKGISMPVEVVEVLWEPMILLGKIPLPGPVAGASNDVLFGSSAAGTNSAS